MNKVKDVTELYVLADKCARAEEGRKYPGEDADAETDSTHEDTAAPTKKGRRHNRKHKGKTVLAVEGSGELGAAKKAKADDPGKEVAVCAACLALEAAGKPGGSDKQYYKIHRTTGHDLQICRQVELLAEKQKAEYERRDKEKGQDGTEGSSKKRGGQGGCRGKDNQQERPARGRDKKEEDDDRDEDDKSGEHEFQKATNYVHRWWRLVAHLTPPAEAVGA